MKVGGLTALGVPYSTDIAKDLVNYYADKWNVSAKIMWNVVSCENKELNPIAQSGHKYKADSSRWGVEAGQRELSFGLVQIHLPDNPDVSYREAINPDFSLNFLAEALSKGKGGMWTCSRQLGYTK